jgi:hypothetical protein
VNSTDRGFTRVPRHPSNFIFVVLSNCVRRPSVGLPLLSLCAFRDRVKKEERWLDQCSSVPQIGAGLLRDIGIVVEVMLTRAMGVEHDFDDPCASQVTKEFQTAKHGCSRSNSRTSDKDDAVSHGG